MPLKAQRIKTINAPNYVVELYNREGAVFYFLATYKSFNNPVIILNLWNLSNMVIKL